MFGIIEASASSFGVETIRMPIYKIDQIEDRVAEFASKPNGAIVVLPDPFLGTHRDPVIRAMANHRVPAAWHFGFWARDGGLIAYGSDYFELWRAAASYSIVSCEVRSPAIFPCNNQPSSSAARSHRRVRMKASKSFPNSSGSSVAMK
jgi:hypothetical protein